MHMNISTLQGITNRKECSLSPYLRMYIYIYVFVYKYKKYINCKIKKSSKKLNTKAIYTYLKKYLSLKLNKREDDCMPSTDMHLTKALQG